MNPVPELTDDDVIASAIDALEHYAPDSEKRAARLADVPEPILEKHVNRLTDALFMADPAMAMRIANLLPPICTKCHAENYIYYLNYAGDPGYAAGVFVTLKTRSVHRTQYTEWPLDKALWKWMRHTDTASIEDVARELGPDWGALWADHVAVVFGAGRLSRKLNKLAQQSAQQWRDVTTPDSFSVVPVSIWLGDGSRHVKIEQAVVNLLGEHGVEISGQDAPKRGSWFRRLRGQIKHIAGNASPDEIYAQIGRKIEIEVFAKAQSEIDANQGNAAAALVASLQGETEACIQVGSLLALKTNGRIAVLNLTQLELAYLGRNPGAMITPSKALELLQEATDSITESPNPEP